MVDLTDLQRAGHSTTDRAWITNPVRRGVLSLARPYFVRLIEAISAIEGNGVQRDEAERRHQRTLMLEDQARAAQRDDAERMHQRTAVLADQVPGLEQRVLDLEERAKDQTARQQVGSILKDELLTLARMHDALRKDQMAVNHRLGRIEDAAGARDQSEEGLHEKIRQLGEVVEEFRNEQHATCRRIGAMEADAEAKRQPAAMPGLATLRHNLPLAILGTSLVLHDGPYGRFLLRQPDLISDHILAGAFWDSHLKPVIERAGRPDRTAIDAGAYLGFHTTYMARYFRAVYAFEPQVEIYRMLCANLLLNSCHNVTAVNAALYDQAGHMRLADSTDQEIPVPNQGDGVDYERVGNAAALTFRVADAGDATAIPARTVDQLGLTDLGFMKVDTQGSDLHVLRGAIATVQRCRPVIAAEFERELAQGHGNTLDDYRRYFDELDYGIEVLDERSDGKQVDLLATPR